jgi:hypothetical protein
MSHYHQRLKKIVSSPSANNNCKTSWMVCTHRIKQRKLVVQLLGNSATMRMSPFRNTIAVNSQRIRVWAIKPSRICSQPPCKMIYLDRNLYTCSLNILCSHKVLIMSSLKRRTLIMWIFPSCKSRIWSRFYKERLISCKNYNKWSGVERGR